MSNPTRPSADLFRTPSLDDEDAPFLISQSENHDDEAKPPALKFFFSLVTAFRIANFAVSIACTVLLSDSWFDEAVAAFFCVLSSLITVWNAFAILESLVRHDKQRKFEMAIGSFVCSCSRTDGRSGSPDQPFYKRHNYLVNIIDFGLCLIMIIPTVLAFKVEAYWWRDRGPLGGVCIAVVALQAAIAFLGLFSVCRKVKICVYTADDEKAAYMIADSYRDRCPIAANA